MSSEEEGPVAWLRAQIEARKAAAQAATPGPWEFEGDDPADDELYSVHDGIVDLVGVTVAWTRHRQVANGQHMALNDPQDTIARCEAELAILDEHYILTDSDRNPLYEQYSIISPPFPPKDCGCVTCHYASRGGVNGCVTCHYASRGGVNGYGICRTVRLLASGYKHRPGYREEDWQAG